MFGSFDTFVVNEMIFIPLFPQWRFEYVIVSMLSLLEVLLLKNVRGLHKNCD